MTVLTTRCQASSSKIGFSSYNKVFYRNRAIRGSVDSTARFV